MAEDVSQFLDSNLLLSQDSFIYSRFKHTMGLGAVGSGKSRSLCQKVLWLSVLHPGNEGMLGRAYGPELESTTQAQFFEYCDPDLIDSYNKKDRRLVLRSSGKLKSTVLFSHIIDPSPTRKHHSSANWGWFGIDQAEDVDAHHWNDLQSRLRRPDVGKQIGCGVANPKGHDWIWKKWLKPAIDKGSFEIKMVPGKTKSARVEFYTAASEHLCVKTESEENTWLPDGYIENMREHNPPEWVARYVDGSTDEWSGRIYKEFSAQSVHVIDPFDIPKDWPVIVSMDAGGVDPWGITVLRIDPRRGDVFVTNEFYESTTLLKTIADWIKNPQHSGVPEWKEASYVQDPENAQTIYEFNSVHDMNVAPAFRGKKKPGIYRISGYMHRIKGRTRTLPNQGSKHPGSEEVGTVTIYDAPYFWVFNTCPNTIHDLEEYPWDMDKRTNESKEEPVEKGFHLCDALRYGFMEVPAVEELIEQDDELQHMKEHDFYSWRIQRAAAQARDDHAGGARGPNRQPSESEAWIEEVGPRRSPLEEPEVLTTW